VSVGISSAVWERSRASGSTLLVLLALADRADDDGCCWPGEEELATRARVGVRQVRRCLRELEDMGELTTVVQRGRSRSNRYRIVMPTAENRTSEAQNRTPPPAFSAEKTGHPGSENRTSGAENRTSGALKPDIAMSAEPSVNHQRTVIEPSGVNGAATDHHRLMSGWHNETGTRLNAGQVSEGLKVLALYADRQRGDEFFTLIHEAAVKSWRYAGFLEAAKDRLDRPLTVAGRAPPSRNGHAPPRGMTDDEAEEHNRRQLARWGGGAG
jgi:hypothetical protein